MKKNCTVRDLIVYLQVYEAHNPNLIVAFDGENGSWSIQKGELNNVVHLTSDLDYLNDKPYESNEQIILIG